MSEIICIVVKVASAYAWFEIGYICGNGRSGRNRFGTWLRVNLRQAGAHANRCQYGSVLTNGPVQIFNEPGCGRPDDQARQRTCFTR